MDQYRKDIVLRVILQKSGIKKQQQRTYKTMYTLSTSQHRPHYQIETLFVLKIPTSTRDSRGRDRIYAIIAL